MEDIMVAFQAKNHAECLRLAIKLGMSTKQIGNGMITGHEDWIEPLFSGGKEPIRKIRYVM